MWTKKITIKKVTPKGTKKQFDQLLIEKKTTLFFNQKEKTVFYHTQVNQKELIKGYLLATHQEKIISMKEDQESNTILITKSKKQHFESENIQMRLHDTVLFNLTSKFQEKAILFKDTAISESAAFTDKENIISFGEDIDGINSFYKALGCLSEKQLININNFALLVSFKIDLPLINLCINIGINTIISRTAATSLAYEKAQEHNIKLIGFARGTKYSIYT